MKLPTDPNKTYTSPKGRDFRVSGVEMLPETEKWIGRVLKYHWRVTIVFLDDGKFEKLLYGYSDEFISIEEC